MEDIMQMPKEVDVTGEDADRLIDRLQLFSLDEGQQARLRMLAPAKRLDIHAEIQYQYDMINMMKSRVLSPNNQLMANVAPKDISSLVNSFNSFLTLYLRSQEKLDKDKQLREIETAVAETITAMPKEVQEEFLSELKTKLEL